MPSWQATRAADWQGTQMPLQRPLWQMRRQRLLQVFNARAHQGVETFAHDLDFRLLLRLQMQGGMKRSVDLGFVEQESVLGLLCTVRHTRAGRCQNSPCCGDASSNCDSVQAISTLLFDAHILLEDEVAVGDRVLGVLDGHCHRLLQLDAVDDVRHDARVLQRRLCQRRQGMSSLSSARLFRDRLLKLHLHRSCMARCRGSAAPTGSAKEERFLCEVL